MRVSAMLPVGIRNASMTKARNTKARMKAVMSHSNALAISAARSFFCGAGFFPSGLGLLLAAIHLGPVSRYYLRCHPAGRPIPAHLDAARCPAVHLWPGHYGRADPGGQPSCGAVRGEFPTARGG